MNLTSLRSKFTTEWQRVDWGRTALLILLILAVFSALWQYLMPQVKEINTTTFKRTREIQKVRDVQRIYVPCPEQGVVALDKHEVAQKLDMHWLEAVPAQQGQAELAIGRLEPGSQAGLLIAGEPVQAAEPAPVPGDPAALQVTATAELPKTDNGQKVVAVLNTDTGVTTLVSKENPSPWWEWNNALVLGLRYGINTSLEKTGTVYGSWEFLRVKQFHLIGYGELNTNAEGKIQADIQYRR